MFYLHRLGCPFRHTDPELLKQRLQSQMMSKDVVDEVIIISSVIVCFVIMLFICIHIIFCFVNDTLMCLCQDSFSFLSQIISLCKTSHYQLACGRYFDWSHKSDTKFNPNHPNQYFEESQHFLSGDRMSQNDKG